MLSTKCLTWQAPVLAITANPDMFIAVIVCNAAVFGLLNIILTLHVAVGKRPKKYIFWSVESKICKITSAQTLVNLQCWDWSITMELGVLHWMPQLQCIYGKIQPVLATVNSAVPFSICQSLPILDAPPNVNMPYEVSSLKSDQALLDDTLTWEWPTAWEWLVDVPLPNLPPRFTLRAHAGPLYHELLCPSRIHTNRHRLSASDTVISNKITGSEHNASNRCRTRLNFKGRPPTNRHAFLLLWPWPVLDSMTLTYELHPELKMNFLGRGFQKLAHYRPLHVH